MRENLTDTLIRYEEVLDFHEGSCTNNVQSIEV